MALSEFFARQYPRNQMSKAAQIKEARWHRRGNYYMGKSGRRNRYMRDSDLVFPDPQLERKIFQLIEQAYPAIAASFNKHLGPMAVAMFKNWPYETGLSLHLLAFEWEITETTLGGSIVCRAPYTYFIREGQKGKEKGRKVGRELTPEELEIMAKPPRGVTKEAWKQAVVVSAKQVDLVNYGYAIGVLRKIGKAQKRRRAPRKGRRVADALVFEPGKVAAGRIYDDILDGLSRQ